MTNKPTDTNVPDTMQINNVTFIALADYARLHDANGDRLRGMARDNKLPGAKQLFGKTWIVPYDMNVPATAPRAASRPDGRKPYTVYLTDGERADVATIIPVDNIIDPRAVSRAKRAAKRDDNATD